MNFWQDIDRPFLAVAPMADVTDAAFRRMIAKYSREEGGVGGGFAAAHPSFITWTEFVAADGLLYAPPDGRAKLLADLLYDESERPIVAQIFSGKPPAIEAAARLCQELGFDGIDINMGCPVQKIAKQGAGSALIQDPDRAVEVIHAAKQGAGTVPVSVKTRLGYHEEEIETWIPTLLSATPAALTVHCRTRKDMSKVPARWDRLVRIGELRDQISPETLIIGNGDVLSPEDACTKIVATSVDGAMVGRALFGNPWFFHPTKRLPHNLISLPTTGVRREDLVESVTEEDPNVVYISLRERLNVLVEHTHLFAELLPHKSFNIMKKHYKGYVNGFPAAGKLRGQLMQATNPAEVASIVQNFLTQYSE